MRALTIVMAVALTSVGTASAATYYVDAATGVDSRTSDQAQSRSTPWKTISAAAKVAAAGDTVLVAPGFYREKVAPVNAGSAAKPIVYRALDPSARPVIDGSELLADGWSDVKLVNFRGQTVTAKKRTIDWKPSALFCGAMRLTLAHEPEQVNGDDPYELERMMTISSDNPGTSKNTLVDKVFFTQTAADYWKGADLLVYYRGQYGNGNVIEERTIASYSPSARSVTVSPDFGYTFTAFRVTAGDKWALRNHIRILDAPGEYFVEGSAAPYTLYVIPPAGHVASEISATKYDYGFDVSFKQFHTISGFEFRGQTAAGVFSQYGNANGQGLVVTNCAFRNELKNGVRVNGTFDVTIVDCDARLCSNEGITFGSGRDFRVIGCTVCSNANNGVWFGSGPDGQYFAASNILVRGCLVFGQSGRRLHADNYQMQQCDNVEISCCRLIQEGEQNGWCQYTGSLVFTNNVVVNGAFGFGAVRRALIANNLFDRATLRFDAHLDDAPIKIDVKTWYLPVDVDLSNNVFRASAMWWPWRNEKGNVNSQWTYLASAFATGANYYVPPAKADVWTQMSTWDLHDASWSSPKGVGYGADSIVATDPEADVSPAAVAALFAPKGLAVGPDPALLPSEPGSGPVPPPVGTLRVAEWALSGSSTLNQAVVDARVAVLASNGVDLAAMRGLCTSATRYVSGDYTFAVTNATNGSSDGNGRLFAWKTARFTQIGAGGEKQKPTTNSSTDWVVLRDNETSREYVLAMGYIAGAAWNHLNSYVTGVSGVLAAMTNGFPSATVIYCASLGGATGLSDFKSKDALLADLAKKGLYPVLSGDDYEWILTTDPSLSASVETFADARYSESAGYVATFGGEPAAEDYVYAGVRIPGAWLAVNVANWSSFAADAQRDAALAATAAKHPRSVFACYVLGLAPNAAGESEDFTITSVKLPEAPGGVPALTWAPDLGSARVYTVEGAADPAGPFGAPTASSRFFRVKVSVR